jgi:hypothetical protein
VPRRPSRPSGRTPGSRPPTVVTGTKRGLTILGAVLITLACGYLGAVFDLIVFGHLAWFFGVGFVGGCFFAASRVHDDDLIGAVILPPLVYAAITITVGLVHPADGGSGSGLKNDILNVGSELILRAPPLIVAMIVVIGVTGVRYRRVRINRIERERTLAATAQPRRRQL